MSDTCIRVSKMRMRDSVPVGAFRNSRSHFSTSDRLGTFHSFKGASLTEIYDTQRFSAHLAQCEPGCQPPRVDRGMGNSFTAVADSCRTLPNLLILSSHVFLSRFGAFSIPSRTPAGDRRWQSVISNISEPWWLPNALIPGRSLRRANGRGSTTGCLAALRP